MPRADSPPRKRSPGTALCCRQRAISTIPGSGCGSRKGAEHSASDYIGLRAARADFIARMDALCAPFDALVLPTVPVVAPTIAELKDDRAYARMNLLALRNPSVVNFFDGCAISLPCHAPGEAPVGLMIAARHGSDERLFAIASAIEEVLEVKRG